MQRVLCPIDFSEYSHDVLQHAASVAQGAHTEVVALHVLPPPAPAAVPGGPGLAAYPMPGAIGPEGVADQSTERGGAKQPAVEDRLRQLTDRYPIECAALVRQGTAADVIVEVAREQGVDQIVMGTHGRSGWRRVLLGSTAEAVVREAPCPVTVVKHDGLGG